MGLGKGGQTKGSGAGRLWKQRIKGRKGKGND